MRLVCPNCGAQYEVDDRVIPESGRDVQCSNCGHTWFQLPKGHPDEAGEEAGSDTPVSPPPEPAPEPAPEPEPEPVPEPEPEPAPEPEAQPEPAPEPARQPLDEELARILREEAEREARERERERAALQTQEDLGLDNVPPSTTRPEAPAASEKAVAAQERMARLRGLDTGEDSARNRRDLLPDIEEINSSLDSIGTPDTLDNLPAPPVRRGGFGRGFVLMLLLAAIAVALYLYAPLIAQKVPALTPALEVYVGWVDQARGWIDRMVALALDRLQPPA